MPGNVPIDFNTLVKDFVLHLRKRCSAQTLAT